MSDERSLFDILDPILGESQRINIAGGTLTRHVAMDSDVGEIPCISLSNAEGKDVLYADSDGFWGLY